MCVASVSCPLQFKRHKPLAPPDRKTEIARHKTQESGVWVTFRDGVYDVTDFVRVHPGGNKILLAAGCVPGFWIRSSKGLHMYKSTSWSEQRGS